MHDMNAINLPQIAALLRATPHTLRSELTSLDPEILRWRPGLDNWCINEIIGHLIDSDCRAFAGRIQTMIAQERPSLKTWDVNAVVGAYVERDTFELIAELEALREEYTQWLVELTPEQLLRSGVHPRAGELHVVDFVQEWPYDDRSHLKQILSIVQRFLWDNMGKIRDFIDPPK